MNVPLLAFRPELEAILRQTVRRALRIALGHPRFARTLVRLWPAFGRAARLRRKNEVEGIVVPPFMALSITTACNLKCQGCYAQTLHPAKGQELSLDEWTRVLAEAEGLGVSVVTVLGGEPLSRKILWTLVERFPRLVFLVFTNGTLIDAAAVEKIRQLGNFVPMLSVEGYGPQTDGRRGRGVYARLAGAVELLRRRNVFFGASITATQTNFDVTTDRRFIDDLYSQGCRVFFYIEYLPADGERDLCLDDAQKRRLVEFVNDRRRKKPAFFLDFPGEEYELGVCLSAGRGFLHLSADGDVEPCPFSPHSDSNLRTKTLRESLASPLFAKLLSRPAELEDSGGNCALFENDGLVKGWSETSKS